MAQIRLVGTVNIPPICGHDGHVIEVTPENAGVAESLLQCGSARRVKEASDVPLESQGPQLEKLSPDQLPAGVLIASSGKLTRESPVADLSNLGVHGRYIKALVDAQLLTVGDVAARGDKLEEVPGVSAAAAKQIAAAIAEERKD